MFHTIVLGITTTETCIMFAITLNQKRGMRLVPKRLLLFISLPAAFLGYDLDEISVHLCSFCLADFFRLLAKPQTSRRKKEGHKNRYSRENRTIINKQPNKRKILIHLEPEYSFKEFQKNSFLSPRHKQFPNCKTGLELSFIFSSIRHREQEAGG